MGETGESWSDVQLVLGYVRLNASARWRTSEKIRLEEVPLSRIPGSSRLQSFARRSADPPRGARRRHFHRPERPT